MVTSTESRTKFADLLTHPEELRARVEIVVNSMPVMDVHTHLFPSEFNELCLYGIDELLTYHYLTAETLRSARISHDRFCQRSKTDQADLVWQTLFVENSPASEAARGIVTVLDAFGLDTRAENLDEARAFFNSRRLGEHITRVFDIARVSGVVMTNDPFDDAEGEIWKRDVGADPRFKSALRLDHLLNGNYVTGTTTSLRHSLDEWIARMNPVYMGVSLPADFKFPADDTR